MIVADRLVGATGTNGSGTTASGVDSKDVPEALVAVTTKS